MNYADKPKIAWSAFPTVQTGWQDLILRPMEKSDVAEFCVAVRDSYPHLGLGRFAYMHQQGYYEQAARPVEGRDGTGIICGFSGGKLVYGLVSELDPVTRSIMIAAVFVTTEFRKNPPVIAALRAAHINMYHWFVRSNIEYAFTYCTASHTVSQTMMEEYGFKVGGIMPGFALSKMGYGIELPVESDYYRENLVYYYRFFNDGEQLTNKRLRFTAQAQKFWDLQK
jgi:hypothetical protein